MRLLRWLPVLAALTLGLSLQHGCGRGEEPVPGAGRGNLILIVVDTLRSDALCTPEGGPASMPFCHALARRGVLFPNAVAPAPWTQPTMASLLTGLTPREHRQELMMGSPPLARGVRTWAQVMGQAGFQTAAYVASPFQTAGPEGHLRGFDGGRASFVFHGGLPALTTWRRSLDPRRPFFLLLHMYEAHDPYGEENHPPEGTPPKRARGFDPLASREPHELARRFMLSLSERSQLHQALGPAFMNEVVRYLWSGYRADPRPELAAELERAYRDGTRWVDGLVRDVVEYFEREGLLSETLLVLTADHGEAFGEHGTLEHGRVMYDEVLRVPLVMLGPGRFSGGRVLPACVSLMDVMPTCMEHLGVAPPGGTSGTSLTPVLEGREGGRVAASYERVNFDVTREDIDLTLRSARSDRWKVILTWDVRARTLKAEAYDLSTDPGERRDLARGTGSLAGLAFDAPLEAELERLLTELETDGAPMPPWRARPR